MCVRELYKDAQRQPRRTSLSAATASLELQVQAPGPDSNGLAPVSIALFSNH